jgi:DHA1 family multidrug resistance protein-like MFS transporter
MNQSLKPSILSALILAFSSFGDAFLYTALPANALQMNIPVVWIGFVLSINRFVRLLANQMFAHLFNKFGFKRITILAAIFSIVTTFLYGFAGGILLWIIIRAIWGFCFSALRISAISYSLENKRQGFSLGINKAVQEVGPIIALLVGPLLLKWTSPSITFLIFSFASVPAVIISCYLPELKYLSTGNNFSLKIIPSSFDLLTFLSSFFVQGILILTLIKLLGQPNIPMINLTAIAGVYLAYRRLCTVFISPFGGILSDKWGLEKAYLASLFFTIAGLLLITMGLTRTGIITAFTFNSVTAALSPGNAVAGSSNRLKAVATNSTWSDIGAATGTLIAGSFLLFTNLQFIFFIATFVLFGACIIHIKTINFQTKELIKWK